METKTNVVTTRHLTRVLRVLEDCIYASPIELQDFITGFHNNARRCNNAILWLLNYNLIKQLKKDNYIVYCLPKNYEKVEDGLKDRFVVIDDKEIYLDKFKN